MQLLYCAGFRAVKAFALLEYGAVYHIMSETMFPGKLDGLRPRTWMFKLVGIVWVYHVSLFPLKI